MFDTFRLSFQSARIVLIVDGNPRRAPVGEALERVLQGLMEPMTRKV